MLTGFALVAVFLAGCAVGAAVFVAALRRKMIVTTDSRYSFDETERRLREQGPATPGWGFPIPELNFVEALSKKGFAAEGIRQAKIFFLCNPKYASAVVGAEHRMIGMMPCHWALFETAAGQVRISRLNIPLMSRMFGGLVGETMTQVGRDERSMVPRITGEGGSPAAASPAAP